MELIGTIQSGVETNAIQKDMNRVIIFSVALILLFGCKSPSSENEGKVLLSTTSIPAEGGKVIPQSGYFDINDKVEIKATPNEGWLFAGWKGDYEGAEASFNISVEKQSEFLAEFIPKDYPLEITVSGNGNVLESVPPGKQKDYKNGTDVLLTAEADSNWKFDRWEGDLDGSKINEVITVDGPKSVTAYFVKKEYSLTVEVEGIGRVDEEVIKAKSTSHKYETEVKLTAIADSAWGFVGWEGALSGTKNPQKLVVDEPKSVKAKFATSPSVSTVRELEANAFSALIESKIIDNGGSSIITSGACLSTDKQPTINDNCNSNSTRLGKYKTNLTNLLRDTTYYVRSYSENKIGMSYGNEISFKTDDGVISLETGSAQKVKDGTVLIDGNILDSGGTTVESKGIVWSTTPNPTVLDNKIELGNGVDSFSTEISNLKPGVNYYFRSYAQNSISTYYGNNQEHYIFEYKIGDVGPGGGIIFYLDENYEYDFNYLEVASKNWFNGTEPKAIWGCFDSDIPTGEGVGTGSENTTKILNHYSNCGTYTLAAKIATEYNGGSLSDWFLPSEGELRLVYKNLHDIPEPLGDFSNTLYWTSTSAFQDEDATALDFSTILFLEHWEFKTNEFKVRPIRSF